MPNLVQILRSAIGGKRPAPGTREPGELYVNFADKKLGYIDDARNPIDLDTPPPAIVSTVAPPTPQEGDLWYNDSPPPAEGFYVYAGGAWVATAPRAPEAFPIGSIFISTSAANPAGSLGYGTWVAYGQGRALVGVGQDGGSNWAAGQKKGSETHTLTTGQIPSHTHPVDPPATTTSQAGGHNHVIRRNWTSNGYGGAKNVIRADIGSGDGLPNSALTDGTPNHAHSVDIPQFNSKSTGGNGSHNNIQPSIAVYVWRRTA